MTLSVRERKSISHIKLVDLNGNSAMQNNWKKKMKSRNHRIPQPFAVQSSMLVPSQMQVMGSQLSNMRLQ